MIQNANITALAKPYNLSRSAVRKIARDLGLNFGYSRERKCYVIIESASDVRALNEHLEGLQVEFAA